MSTTGVVLSVDVERYGDTLATTTTATDLVLSVDDIVDFADEDDFAAGPQWLKIGDSAPMQYVSVDDEADTITLALAVGAVYEAGSPVRMWDAAADAEVVSFTAWIELDDAEADDQPVPAEVRHEDMIFFGINDLAGLIGARVSIEPDEDDPGIWYVSQVHDRAPKIDVGALGSPLYSSYLAADQSIPSGVQTRVDLTAELHDINAYKLYSALDEVQMLVGGTYLIAVLARWTANSTGQRRIHVISSFVGVDTEVAVVRDPAPSSGQLSQTVTLPVSVLEKTSIRVEAHQNSGGALNLEAGMGAATILRIVRLR